MKTLLSMLALAALLTACGGSGSSSTSETPPGGDGNNSASADAFINSVAAVVNATSEDSEPGPIESTSVTAPEDTEAAPII